MCSSVFASADVMELQTTEALSASGLTEGKHDTNTHSSVVTLKGALPLGTLRKCASNVRVKAKFVLE
jgi:hypothetical protein